MTDSAQILLMTIIKLSKLGKLLVDERLFKDNTFQVKCSIFEINSVNGKMSSKIYHIQVTLKARPHWHSENDFGPSQNVFTRPHCNR